VIRKTICFLVCLSAICAFALPKSWDSIFKTNEEANYASAKISGNVRLGKYTHYKNVQPVSFKVDSEVFSFAVSGNMTVPAEVIEKGDFFSVCNTTKEAWISYFGDPETYGKEDLVVHVAGVDLACGDILYAVGDIKIKFFNKKAQDEWNRKYEKGEKYKRELLVNFRREEQEHRATIRDNSSQFKDPRDGQVYRTIKIEGREWFAQNVNYNVPGHSWCYEDKDNYCVRSGRLYDLEGARKACPEGWHLPRDREWQDMLTGLTQCYDGVDKCGAFASKLKATTGWHGGGGTDEYGFTVFSSGYRKMIGSKTVRYEDMGEYAGFWSSQNGRNETIWLWAMGRMSDQMVRQLVNNKGNAYSVRCINGN